MQQYKMQSECKMRQRRNHQHPIKSDWGNITVENPRIINTTHVINTIALSPNCKYIASAGEDGYSIKIWDPINGNQVGNSLEGHDDVINSINYSKCGNFIVSGSDDYTIRQWSLLNYKQFGKTMNGHKGFVYGVEYTADQRYIVSCSYDQTIRLWNPKLMSEYVDKQIEHSSPIFCLSLSPTSSQVAFGDELCIWDYEMHKQIGQFMRQGAIKSIQYQKDGRLILFSNDNKIYIWDVSRGRIIRSLLGHTQPVFQTNFSPDQRYIISGAEDNTVRIWDRATGKQMGQSLTHHKVMVSCAQFSFCGQYIITAGEDMQIKIMLVPINQLSNQDQDIKSISHFYFKLTLIMFLGLIINHCFHFYFNTSFRSNT